MAALLAYVMACAHEKPPAPAKPLEVRIVEMPPVDRQTCYIEDFPTPPDPIVLDFENDNIVSRVFVHYLKFNEQVQFDHDIAMWAVSVRECLTQHGLLEP